MKAQKYDSDGHVLTNFVFPEDAALPKCTFFSAQSYSQKAKNGVRVFFCNCVNDIVL